MNLLNQVLNISPLDSTISDEEYKLTGDILDEVGLPRPNKDGIKRVLDDFFLTQYIVSYDNKIVFLRLSPHEFIFEHDKKLTSIKYLPIISPLIGEGKVLDKFYYSVTWMNPCFPMSVAKQETIGAATHYFAGLSLLAKDQYPSDQLKPQEEVYQDIFNLYQFTESLPAPLMGKLTKMHREISPEFLKEISETSFAFFKKHLLDKHPTGTGALCFGPLRASDVVLEDVVPLPHVVTAPYLMKGNPKIEAACFPYYLGINREKFYRAYASNEKEYRELDYLSKYAWIVDFYLTLIGECILSSMEVGFHNENSLLGAAKYQKYRGWINHFEEFNKWGAKLDSIFLEKLIK